MFYSMLASEAFEKDILKGMNLKSVVQTVQFKQCWGVYMLLQQFYYTLMMRTTVLE